MPRYTVRAWSGSARSAAIRCDRKGLHASNSAPGGRSRSAELNFGYTLLWIV